MQEISIHEKIRQECKIKYFRLRFYFQAHKC